MTHSKDGFLQIIIKSAVGFTQYSGEDRGWDMKGNNIICQPMILILLRRGKGQLYTEKNEMENSLRGNLQTLLLRRRDGRAVECGGLENR